VTTDTFKEVSFTVIDAIYRYRFLTQLQLQRLFPSLTIDHLDELILSGHLVSITRPAFGSRTADTVYAIAGRGADVIAETRGIDRGEVRWRKYHNLVGLPYLDHRLATNDLRIALTVGSPLLGAALAHWYYEPPIREAIDDPVEPGVQLSFRPDAYLRLRFNDGRTVHAFVEIDMATESNLRFAGKVRRYVAYKDSRLFRSRVGGRAFRVLITVPTTARLAALKRVVERYGGGRMFWLARQSQIGPDQLSTANWHLGGSDERASIIAMPSDRNPQQAIRSDP
jgi:hypothetical protein